MYNDLLPDKLKHEDVYQCYQLYSFKIKFWTIVNFIDAVYGD